MAVDKQDSRYPTNDGSSCYHKVVCYNESKLVVLKFIPYYVRTIHKLSFYKKAKTSERGSIV